MLSMIKERLVQKLLYLKSSISSAAPTSSTLSSKISCHMGYSPERWNCRSSAKTVAHLYWKEIYLVRYLELLNRLKYRSLVRMHVIILEGVGEFKCNWTSMEMHGGNAVGYCDRGIEKGVISVSAQLRRFHRRRKVCHLG